MRGPELRIRSFPARVFTFVLRVDFGIGLVVEAMELISNLVAEAPE